MDRVISWCSIAIAACMACSAHAANLVPNPEFDQGIADWTPTDGSIVAIDDIQGFPVKPSLHLQNISTCCASVVSACIVTDAVAIDFSFWRKAMNGRSGSSVYTYADTTCQTETSASHIVAIAGDEIWTPIDRRVALPNGTRAVKVGLVTNIGSFGIPGDAYFDHVDVQALADLVFVGDFESSP